MTMDTKKGTQVVDWHPADVKAALEKRGVSLRALAAEYGYSHIQRVLTSHWWAAEQVVAKALGVPASQIWPSRYAAPRSRGQGMTRNAAVLSLASKRRPTKAAQPVAQRVRKAA